jgi:glycosyltransferase involved in cell wall biosynthesis
VKSLFVAGGIVPNRPTSKSQVTNRSMKKVRILFMPPVDVGSVNAQSLNVRELVLRFDPERLESTLWYETEPDPRLRDREGIRLLQLPSSRKTVRILREQLAGYDLIGYTDCSPATYIFLHLPRALRKGTATVFHAEGTNPSAQLASGSALMRRLYQGILPNCDVHTAITDCVARDMEGMRVSSQYILPVGVDLRSFSPPASRPNTTPTVLFVGTLIERKGPADVVQAAAHFPHVRFRLVGSARDGYEGVLQRSVAERGLRNVTIEGSKTQQDIAEIMRESDILLLPSRLEGMPKVTLEAAATGLPCIVFNDYQTPSVVHGVTGFQVSSFDEMVKSLGTLLQDSELRRRMGAEARQHVQQFDWEVVAKIWSNAYLEIAATRT